MEYSETLAEVIGIILGDGSLRYDNENHKYNLTIYLNGVDDYEYYQYVKKFLDRFFQTDIYEYWYKDSEAAQGNEKGVSLTIYDKEILHSLIKKGLIPGNKIVNNISVPNWIKSENLYSLRCLKGLTDTDGYIGVVKTNDPHFSKIGVTYTSKLKTLVNDFKEMSEKNNIKCSNIHGPYSTFDNRTKGNYTLYSVSIHSKEQVNKFLQLVKPKKWEFRRNLIGKILYLYSNVQEYRKIKQQIQRRHGNLNFFEKEQENFLDSLINVSEKDIENSLSEAFSYHKMHYSNEFAEELKENLIQLGSLREVEDFYNQEETHNFKIYRKSIIKYLQKLFTQDSRYKELYAGVKGFNKWKKYNFNIIIREQFNNKSIHRYPFFIKEELCKEIYHIMEDINNINEIYKNLENIIENEDLNGEIIDKQDFHVLKFERLAYLLKDPNTKGIIHSELKSLIYVVKEFKNLLKDGKKLKLEGLSSLLRKKYNLNWRNENLKALLIHLNLYDDLIKQDLNLSQAGSPVEKEEDSNEQSHIVNEKKNINDIDEKNKTKNIHTSNFYSSPYPYNNPKNEIDEIDFTEMYTWLSPQVREQIMEKAESLQEEVRGEARSKDELQEEPMDKSKENIAIKELKPKEKDIDISRIEHYEILRRAREFDESLTYSEINLDANIHVDFNDVFDLPQEEFINGEDQDLLIGDESDDLLSQDQEYDSEAEISEELFSEDGSYFDQEQELSESEFGPEEEVGSDSTLDEADINPPLSEESAILEDPDNYPEPTTANFPEEIIDSINEHMKGAAPESAMGEGANQEDLDPLSKADDIQSESESIGERSSSLEGDDDQVDNDQNNPADKIQGQDIDETKEESRASDDKVSNREIDDDNSDDLDEGRESSQENTDDTSGITPEEDIYDPINVPINDLDPMISSFQSSSLGDYWHNFENSPQANFKDGFNEDQSVLAFDEVGEASTINKDALDDKIEDIIDDFSFV